MEAERTIQALRQDLLRARQENSLFESQVTLAGEMARVKQGMDGEEVATAHRQLEAVTHERDSLQKEIEARSTALHEAERRVREKDVELRASLHFQEAL